MPALAFVAGRALHFDVERAADGQVRTDVWDRFTSWGEKIKEGRLSVFDENTLGQMMRNWIARGDKLAMCFNHQSAYVEKNGQPAPALAFYDALAVVQGGKVIAATALPGSRAAQVQQFEAASRGDGLYGFRCDVTKLGQELLPNFAFISPMFTDDGRDELGREIGYVLFDVAATNTPFQAGCEITFDGVAMAMNESEVRVGSVIHDDNGAFGPAGGKYRVTQKNAQGVRLSNGKTLSWSDLGRATEVTYDGAGNAEGERTMAKLGKLAKFAGLKDDADDSAIKQSVLSRMSSEASKAMEEESYNYGAAADEFEEMAKAYEDAQMDEEGGTDAPHVTMRKMASKFRRMAKMGTLEVEGNGGPGQEPTSGQKPGGETVKEKPTMSNDGDADDKKAMAQMQAFAQRLGIQLPAGLTRVQMVTALDAASAPTSQLPALIAKEVERSLAAADQKRVQIDTIKNAKELVDSLEGYPEANKKALLAFASDPKTFDAAVAIAKPFLKAGAESLLFSRMTAGGNPVGLSGDAARAPGSPAVGRRIYENQLATFIVDDEAIAAKIVEYADAKDGAMKMEIDAMLSESERDQPDARWIAADRLVRTKKHPEMWEATKRASLF